MQVFIITCRFFCLFAYVFELYVSNFEGPYRKVPFAACKRILGSSFMFECNLLMNVIQFFSFFCSLKDVYAVGDPVYAKDLWLIIGK